MRNIWLKVITHKANPLHWPALFILWICSLLYRLGLCLNNLRPKAKVKTSAPTISVGNLTVGGSGKTPVVIELARYYSSKGKKVGIVSSGYGRRSKKSISGTGRDIVQKSINDTGDEVMMMAEDLPDMYFAISCSKSDAAVIIDRKFHPDLIIIDDGFQHRKLHRDYNILIIDASVDLRKERLFPLGRRREPLEAMVRADAIILTKANMAANVDDFRNWINTRFRDKAITEFEFRNDAIISKERRIALDAISEEGIYFFAGIGGFDALLNHLKTRFRNIVGFRQFSDHCRYTRSDMTLIRKDADRLKPDYLITTHKDYVKIIHFDFGRPVYYLDLQLWFVSGEKHLLAELDGIPGNQGWKENTTS